MKGRPRDRYGRPLPQGSPDELDPRRAVAERAGSDPRVLAVAAALFDDQRFFEAHEIFEALWKSPGVGDADRPFWKGLAQLAVALCHAQRGNFHGTAVLLDRAGRRLAGYPSPHCGVDTARLRVLATAAQQLAAAGAAPAPATLPPFPLVGQRSS
jgi:hypothetical protein